MKIDYRICNLLKEDTIIIMCKFCDDLKNKTKEIKWNVRSTYADDNICEFINGQNCELCDSCNGLFNLSVYEYNKNSYISVSYNQKIASNNGVAIIRPFSEGLQFNYCPFCGKQISENIIEFSKIPNHIIEIEDV